MQINRLEVKNFRCFADRAWEFAPRFNLLAGENGKGKTTVLEAVTFALNGLVGPLFGSHTQTNVDEIRTVRSVLGESVLFERQYPLQARFVGQFAGQPLSWTWEVSEIKYALETRRHAHVLPEEREGRRPLLDLRLAAAEGREAVLPLVVYFPCDRLADPRATRTVRDDRHGSRLAGYIGWRNSAVSVGTMMEWFRDMEGKALQSTEPVHTLHGVKDAVLRCVSGATSMRYDFGEKDLIIERIDGSALPFKLLSHGYRLMIGMVANLAWRCAALNPQFLGDAPVRTDGIVLIDEIDMHLHPKWQRGVVERLCAAFPKLQFIATSHSPFIIQSLSPSRGDRLINLDDPEAEDVENKSIEEIAEENQGLEGVQRSQRFQEMVAAAEEYYRVLRQANGKRGEEVERLKARLDELLLPYRDDPAYVAFLRIERAASGIEGGA